MLDDEEAMFLIQILLDGKEWDSETIEAVAAVVEATGRKIREPETVYAEPAGDGQLID